MSENETRNARLTRKETVKRLHQYISLQLAEFVFALRAFVTTHAGGTLKRNLRKLTITKLLHRAKNSGVKKSERKIALDSLFPHDALSIIILEKEYPEGSDGTHQSNRSLVDETLEEKTNRETAAAALARRRNHPLLDAGHCNEPLGELPGRESEMTTVSGEFVDFNADAEEMANPVADAPLGEADKGEADKDVA